MKKVLYMWKRLSTVATLFIEKVFQKGSLSDSIEQCLQTGPQEPEDSLRFCFVSYVGEKAPSVGKLF